MTELICEKTIDFNKAINVMKTVRRLSEVWMMAARVVKKSKSQSFNPLLFMIKQVQKVEHPDVYDFLSKGRDLPHTHQLSSLCPFMDGDIIRVGGRLRHSDLSYEGKHPALCLLYTSPSPRDKRQSRMPSSA